MTELQLMAMRRIAKLARDMKFPNGYAGTFEDQKAVRAFNLEKAKDYVEAEEVQREITEWANALLKETD